MIIAIIKILAWPLTVLIVLIAVRPILDRSLKELLSGAKITLSLFGQAVELTIPELKSVLSEQVGGTLTAEQNELLKELYEKGGREYPEGLSGSELSSTRKLMRPLRNAGLIRTLPQDAFLGRATAIHLTKLGNLYAEHKFRQ